MQLKVHLTVPKLVLVFFLSSLNFAKKIIFDSPPFVDKTQLKTKLTENPKTLYFRTEIPSA